MLSEANQRAYLRLKLALGLNLRRQIFLAICDDLALRNYLASCLAVELTDLPGVAGSAEVMAALQTSPCQGMSLPIGDRVSSQNPLLKDSRLVSLPLDLANPDPLAQIARWKAEVFPGGRVRRTQCPITFQFLGIEHLTRQSAVVQGQFLRSLQQLGESVHLLDGTLLLWLPRPWLHAIQQSAAEFWSWHTALFEFEGDPTPVLSERIPATSQVQSTRQSLQQQASQQDTSPALTAQTGDSQANLWDVLVQDLARLHLDGSDADAEPVSTFTGATIAASSKTTMAQGQGDPGEHSPKPASGGSPPLFPSGSGSANHEATPDQPPASQQDQTAAAFSSSILALTEQLRQQSTQEEHGIALQVLQQIQQLQQQQAPPEMLASACQQLATFYRDRIEQGDTGEQTLQIAIWAYEQTLTWLGDASPLRADILNDLANLHWMLSRFATNVDSRPAYLEQAIATYQRALEALNPDQSHNYAMLQNNLGSAYSDLARHSQPVENLQRSIEAYQEALKYRTLEDDPARYAATQNNLGTTYWNLAQYQQPATWLQRAILAYQEALHYYSPRQEPIHYAMIKNNLGTAYWNLAQCAQSGSANRTPELRGLSARALLVQAIEAYHAALVYRTLETAPAAHAATQNNLGTAHWHLAMLADGQTGDRPAASTASLPENRRNHLQQAITAYTAALNAVQYLSVNSKPGAAVTFDQFATHNNLGLAYYHLATATDCPFNETQRLQYLESALHHHLQALQGWATQPDFHQTALGYIIQTIRAFYAQAGTRGQNLALSKIPAHLLPEVMKRL